MKQIKLIPVKRIRQEHGGSLLVGRRRKARPLSNKSPLHLVLRSDFAKGRRSLLRHRPHIEKVIGKAQKRFGIRVYEKAIVSNHIHLVVRGRRRTDLQNFFRVVAGHIAQEILRLYPLTPVEKVERRKRGGAHPQSGQPAQNAPQARTREKENKFWQTRIYSRIVSWGKEYFTVKKYVIQNTLEALGIIPYKPRSRQNAFQNSS